MALEAKSRVVKSRGVSRLKGTVRILHKSEHLQGTAHPPSGLVLIRVYVYQFNSSSGTSRQQETKHLRLIQAGQNCAVTW